MRLVLEVKCLVYRVFNMSLYFQAAVVKSYSQTLLFEKFRKIYKRSFHFESHFNKVIRRTLGLIDSFVNNFLETQQNS